MALNFNSLSFPPLSLFLSLSPSFCFPLSLPLSLFIYSPFSPALLLSLSISFSPPLSFPLSLSLSTPSLSLSPSLLLSFSLPLSPSLSQSLSPSLSSSLSPSLSLLFLSLSPSLSTSPSHSHSPSLSLLLCHEMVPRKQHGNPSRRDKKHGVRSEKKNTSVKL